MTHVKRQAAPKAWPIPRKGTKFIIRGESTGIPILILLRDVLKIARTKKEVKRAIFEKNLMVCGKLVKDVRKNVELFDVITLVSSKKNYKLIFTENGKYTLMEIKESEKDKKITKIINKKILKGKKTQLNLLDGRNYLSTIKCAVNDSVIIDFKKNAIEKVLPLKEKTNAIVIGGKHIGKTGVIQKIDKDLKIAEIESNKQKLNVLIRHLMVLE